MNLLPTDEELAILKAKKIINLTSEELLMREYDELLRDKRGVDELPCDQWRDETCHCHEVAGSGHTEPPHNSAEGKIWCAAHQSTSCTEPHVFITFEQFCNRYKITS